MDYDFGVGTIGDGAVPRCRGSGQLGAAHRNPGMTSQVSDVSVATAQMRRTTHNVRSFIFNIALLALSIIVISGVV